MLLLEAARLYQISNKWSQYRMIDCSMKKCDQDFLLDFQSFMNKIAHFKLLFYHFAKIPLIRKAGASNSPAQEWSSNKYLIIGLLWRTPSSSQDNLHQLILLGNTGLCSSRKLLEIKRFLTNENVRLPRLELGENKSFVPFSLFWSDLKLGVWLGEINSLALVKMSSIEAEHRFCIFFLHFLNLPIQSRISDQGNIE